MYITSHSIRIVLLSRYVNIYSTMAPMSPNAPQQPDDNTQIHESRAYHSMGGGQCGDGYYSNIGPSPRGGGRNASGRWSCELMTLDLEI